MRGTYPQASSVASTHAVGRRAGSLFTLVCLCVLGLAAFFGSSAPSVNAAARFPGQGFLPDNRAWEMVTPPDKNGGGAMISTFKTQSASDGSALRFTSLTGFADVVGFGIATDYIAKRSTKADPGHNGWSTHGITPPQEPTVVGVASLFAAEPRHLGTFSDDLSQGIFGAITPLTDAPNVANAFNLYLRDDLLDPGPGSYRLLSDCLSPPDGPCATPLPEFIPWSKPAVLEGASEDFSHVLFSTQLVLANPAPPADFFLSNRKLYEWDEGEVRAVGILPTGLRATRAIAGLRRDPGSATSHPISADGSRIFFTAPASNGVKAGPIYVRINGRSTVQLNASERAVPLSPQPATYWDSSTDGRRIFFTSPEALTDSAPDDGNDKLYMWALGEANEEQSVAIDASSGTFTLDFHGKTTAPIAFDAPAASVRAALETLETVKAGNVSVSGGPGSPGAPTPYKVTFDGDFAGANVAELSASGTELGGGTATVTTTAPVKNLTFLSVDNEPDDGVGGFVEGVFGASESGEHVYFVAGSQLVDGQPLFQTFGIFHWQEGEISYVGKSAQFVSDRPWMFDGSGVNLTPRQSYVTPDGNHLLFNATSGEGLLSAHGGTDYNHAKAGGNCADDDIGLIGCQELYVYTATTDELECASCNPSGAQPTANAITRIRANNGGITQGVSEYHSRPISDDGNYVFFTTADKLVATDSNGVKDAYVYDTATEDVSLLSSGESAEPSFFLEATPNGKDAFFATAESLSDWDFDGSYDIYDARVDGGFPEPPPPPPSCVGDACQPAPLELNDPTPTSSAFNGPGNQRARGKSRPRCPKGGRRAKARGGKSHCVKRQRGSKRAANTGRRAGR